MFAIQFFLVQAIVQLSWTTPFSLASNFISDLGNTACANYPPDSLSYVCSPWHGLMNASFIVLGLTKILGSALLWNAFPRGTARNAGMSLIALSGVGVIVVGLYPENVNGDWHRAGAGIDLVSGNLGIALVGVALWQERRQGLLALLSIMAGTVGLIALWLFVIERYGSLGIGGMERVAAYPVPLWLIMAGCHIGLRSRYTSATAQAQTRL